MRIVVETVAGHPHLFQHLGGYFQRFLFAQFLVLDHHFRQLLADGHDRVQRRHGVLKDHGDPVAAHFLIFLFGVIDQVPALKEDLSVQDDPGWVGDQLHNRQRYRGFPGAGLTHQAQHFTLLQAEVDTVDRLHIFGIGHIVDVQILDFQ